MGKTIERIAQERGHEIVLRVDAPGDYDLSVAEVAIEFSTPQSAFANISRALSLGLPTVAGTTGWLEHYPEAVTLCKEHEAAFLYASNFSIGVNIFFELNKTLAQLMRKYPEYAVAIEEIHHTQKLVEQTAKVGWELGETTEDKIPITAKRIENVPGTHIVTYKSVVDTLEIKHTAHSRDGFALGAVLAAEWIIGKKGVFSMKDVLFGK